MADGRPRRTREIVERLVGFFQLTPDERATTLKSGQLVMINRVGWARTYLKNAGLIASPSRGIQVITDAGQEVLRENPSHIDSGFLERFPSFRAFTKGRPKSTETLESDTETPEENIQQAFDQLQTETALRLLQTLKECDPYFFEQVVVHLLQAMGYGITGSGQITPRSRDGGIDGIIHEDKLGLDTVCVQAKRWDGTVSRRTVQEFVGSMDLYRSRKGVILTTGSFQL